jgi:secreted trypsin-like serine protease
VRVPSALTMLLGAAAIAAAVLPPAAHAAGSPQVVGGRPAAPGQFPSAAYVIHPQPGGPVLGCGGAVVSAHLVLTVAHCALLSPAGYRVVTGAVSPAAATPAQVSAVRRVLIAPGFDPATLRDDAALLVLAHATRAPRVALPQSDETLLGTTGIDAEVAGWGATAPGGPDTGTLQWTATVIEPDPFCADAETDFIPGAQLCGLDFPAEATGTCAGDSGGPVVVGGPPHEIEVGIVDSAPPGCATDAPDIYTATAPLQPWILRTAATVERAAAARRHGRRTQPS